MNESGPVTHKTQQVQDSLEAFLPFSPTASQSRAIYVLARFLLSTKPRCAMLLRGYAGTGKTTLMKALVDYQHSMSTDTILLAPTGRAAKVLGQYTSRQAYTIHRYIYMRSMDENGKASFSIRPNKRKRVIFVVDEASMLADSDTGMSGRLLSDLMSHVFSGEGCRLVLLGDDAQLPPVGLEDSPALDLDHLRDRHDLTIAEHVLDEVVRQAEDSAILSLATAIRHRVFSEDHALPKIDYQAGPAVEHIQSRDLQSILEEAYADYGQEQVRIICRSNKSANLFNKQIRAQVLQMDDELCAGELLMVVRNNYIWSEDTTSLPFIANGELCELMYVKRHADRYGLRFATLGLSFTDLEDIGVLDCNALLDTLDTKTPSMPQPEMESLYSAVQEDLSFEYGPAEARAKLRVDPWLNALQIKYGYAITCHKAQGGQWPVVFVDRGYLPEDGMNREYWRWLYTAVTRASEKVYLIDF